MWLCPSSSAWWPLEICDISSSNITTNAKFSDWWSLHLHHNHKHRFHCHLRCWDSYYTQTSFILWVIFIIWHFKLEITKTIFYWESPSYFYAQNYRIELACVQACIIMMLIHKNKNWILYLCPARVGPKSNTSPQGCFIRIKLRAHYLFKAEIEENYVIGISSTCSYSVQIIRIHPILMSIML